MHGLLTARLDRLTVGKTIAQIAAVIGREFPISVLSGVALMSREQLHNGLRELTQSDIIYPSSIGAGTTYAFRHSLVHEAAYQIQLRSRRQDYHGQVARAYLSAAPRIVDTQPEIVAHHFERAGVREYLGPLLVPRRHAGARAIGLPGGGEPFQERPAPARCLAHDAEVAPRMKSTSPSPWDRP